MTALTLSTGSATKLRADALVVGVAKSGKGLVLAPGAEKVDEAFGGKLTATLETLGATGGEAEVTKLPSPDGMAAPLVVAAGLGDAPEAGDGAYAPEALRRAAGAAARALSGSKKAGFAFPVADPAAAEAVAQGALLGAYAFTTYRSTAASKNGKNSGDDRTKQPLGEATLLGASPDLPAYQAAANRASTIAEAVNRARDLVNTPSNDLDPERFAALVTAAGTASGEESGLKIEVLDEPALTAGGYGGILGVGQGSAKPPRLVKIAYTHPAAERSLAFVGKGITYDSGGISLKTRGQNETMKCDMAGAAAVFAALVAVSSLALPVNVTGWLALAENMPSGTALRPGDVLTMYSGKTVEVLNTDAEGRLVLADALARAAEDNPDAIVDVATLTGAMVLALGNRTFGVMANDDGFRDTVHAAAVAAGEPAWPMPMPGELRKSMESPVADIANMSERMGSGLAAGLFLNEFVPDDVVWAHLDIAGPAFNESAPFGYTPKGGTGSGVRTLVQLAEDAAAGPLSR